MANLIGQSIGRYHVLEQLGEGGMATVYKAYDTRLERDVAVKVLRTELFAPSVFERILKRFEREAKALGKLSHPNIVNVHDYGEYEDQPYLVMEFLPGGTLKDKLGRPMPWQEAVRLLIPIADALAYAHEHGILHRDVKPSNILLAEKGQPMLTDFGIAKILDLEGEQTLTGTGVGIGTPEYMSPEQGLGEKVNESTDVYSLGIVLYELITGRKPYLADTPMAVVVKHLNDPLPRPSEFVPSLPASVENTLLKALAKKPADRYPDMVQFSAVLTRLLTEAGGGAAAPQATSLPASRPAASATIDQGVSRETLPPRTALPPPQGTYPVPPAVRPVTPPARPRKKFAWLAWLAGLGVLFAFVCLLVVGLLYGADIKATLFPTPTPSFVRVAIYDHGTDTDVSYFSGGMMNSWDVYQDLLIMDPRGRFTVTVVQDLSFSTLSGFSRLILPDNAVPDGYLSEVYDWYLSGGKSIIAVDSAVTYISFAGLFWDGSAGEIGEETYWNYASLENDLYTNPTVITADIASGLLGSYGGDAQYFAAMLPADAVILARSSSDPAMIYAACRRMAGGNIFLLGPFEEPGEDLFPLIRNVVFASTCE